MAPATILFVCTGNICRSPLAAAVARQALTTHFQVSDLASVGWHVVSAGTHALVGRSATSEMKTVATEMGLDLSRHRAAQIHADALTAASLVLGMEMNHVDWVRAQSSGRAVGLLGNDPIEDPYGLDISEYRRVGRDIVTAVRKRLPEMIACAD